MSDPTNGGTGSSGADAFPDLTPAELDALASVTPEDIARAQERWREQASPRYRDLLDATPTDDPTTEGA